MPCVLLSASNNMLDAVFVALSCQAVMLHTSAKTHHATGVRPAPTRAMQMSRQQTQLVKANTASALRTGREARQSHGAEERL